MVDNIERNQIKMGKWESLCDRVIMETWVSFAKMAAREMTTIPIVMDKNASGYLEISTKMTIKSL